MTTTQTDTDYTTWRANQIAAFEARVPHRPGRRENDACEEPGEQPWSYRDEAQKASREEDRWTRFREGA